MEAGTAGLPAERIGYEEPAGMRASSPRARRSPARPGTRQDPQALRSSRVPDGQRPSRRRPKCMMSIRFTIGGNYHSARRFACAAKWKSDVPTCCLHHQLGAECAELKRHLGANEKQAALDALDRLSTGLQRNDARAKSET